MPVNTNDEGIQRVMIVPGKEDRKMCVTGVKFDAIINSGTVYDATFSEIREIQGSWLEISNHEPGDYVDLYICDPNGNPLGQHAETVYIPPSGKIEQIVSEGTVSFPAGFRLRIVYTAVNAGSTRTIYCWYRMRK